MPITVNSVEDEYFDLRHMGTCKLSLPKHSLHLLTLTVIILFLLFIENHYNIKVINKYTIEVSRYNYICN